MTNAWIRMLTPEEVLIQVRLAQSGDETALARIVHHFQPLVRRTACVYANVSFEDAEQEGYVALVRCVHSYRLESGIPFAGYAMATVRGDVRTAMRRLWTYRNRTVFDSDDGAGGGAPMDVRMAKTSADPYEGSLLHMCIAQAGLSPRERLSIQGLLAGLTCAELAAQVGVHVETAKTWRKRALRKLRAALLRD